MKILLDWKMTLISRSIYLIYPLAILKIFDEREDYLWILLIFGLILGLSARDYYQEKEMKFLFQNSQ
jgi:hypothetical protein